jgi:transcriptional regulator
VQVDDAQQEYGRVLCDRIRKAERELRRLRNERNALIAVLREDGASQRQVARALGMTPARVAQLDLARATSGRAR